MPRGVSVYIIVSLAASWGCSALAWFLQESLPAADKGKAGFVMLALLAVPLLLVWWLHRQQASAGNPYKGLVWGSAGWYWGLYFGMLAYGALVVGAVIGVGLAGFDPKMSGYIENIKGMMEAQGQPVPHGAEGQLSIGGWFFAIAGPTLGAWFFTALGCLGSFPMLGWLTRRLLTKGRGPTFAILAVFSALSIAGTALLDKPDLKDLGVMGRMGLFVLSSVASLPVLLWVFYRTRSVVLATLATQTYIAAQFALWPFLTGSPAWLTTPPLGVATSAGLLLLGIALWVWKDPGGQDLAVAAVAQDGTPLTPEMLRQAQPSSAAAEAEPGSAAS